MEWTLRPVRREDAPAMSEIRRMPGVIEGITALPSERVESAEGFLAALGPDDHQFVAVTAGEHGGETLIGSAGIVVGPGRQRHSAGLGIMVHPAYQDRGVGRALMEACLDVADNHLMLRRVWLEVHAENDRAIHLYRSLGFEEEGVLRDAIICRGRYEDVLRMARLRQI